MKAPLRILAVEDDEQDVELLRMALAGSGVALETVGDGAAALAFLRHQGPYARKPRQNLVLLDLNMPRMGGRAFLAERRADPDLLSIPVVVLTTSASPRDVGDSYALGANCFVTKPVGYENFRAALAAVARFWSSVAERPGRREA